jgi:hypothetical protein
MVAEQCLSEESGATGQEDFLACKRPPRLEPNHLVAALKILRRNI